METETIGVTEETDDFWNNEEDHKWAMELIKRNTDLNKETL